MHQKDPPKGVSQAPESTAEDQRSPMVDIYEAYMPPLMREILMRRPDYLNDNNESTFERDVREFLTIPSKI